MLVIEEKGIQTIRIVTLKFPGMLLLSLIYLVNLLHGKGGSGLQFGESKASLGGSYSLNYSTSFLKFKGIIILLRFPFLL